MCGAAMRANVRDSKMAKPFYKVREILEAIALLKADIKEFESRLQRGVSYPTSGSLRSIVVRVLTSAQRLHELVSTDDTAGPV